MTVGYLIAFILKAVVTRLATFISHYSFKKMMKSYKYLSILLFISSCISTPQQDIITFNNTKGKVLLRFIDVLRKNPGLDTAYKMDYRVKSPEIYFYYLDSMGNTGNSFRPNIIITKSQINFFFDIGLSVIFRDENPNHFDVHFNYFRNKKKDINMIIFNSLDSLKNSKDIKEILSDNDKIIFVDKNVYYYHSTWHW